MIIKNGGPSLEGPIGIAALAAEPVVVPVRAPLRIERDGADENGEGYAAHRCFRLVISERRGTSDEEQPQHKSSPYRHHRRHFLEVKPGQVDLLHVSPLDYV